MVSANGESRIERRDGFNVLHIQGSPYEMGLQHGRLLRDEIHDGALPYFGSVVEYDPSLRRKNALYKYLITTALDLTVYRRLIKSLPRHYREELHGIADGAGLPREIVLKGNQLSELGQVMARREAYYPAGALNVFLPEQWIGIAAV